jgi:hypothetical protein
MDMTKCKKGDELLLRNGDIAIYEYRSSGGCLFPHTINHNGVIKAAMDDGSMAVEGFESDDVIGFASKEKEKSYVSYITVFTSASTVPMQNKVKVIGTFKEIMESVSTLHRTVSRDIEPVKVNSFEIQTRSPQKDVINIELTLFV